MPPTVGPPPAGAYAPCGRTRYRYGVKSVAVKSRANACPPGTRLLRYGAIAFFAVILSWVIYAVVSGRSGALDEVDLTVYRDGGLIVRHVRPYYDPHAYAPLYDWGGYSSLALKFTYPPFAAVAFALVSILPDRVMVVCSVVGNMLALVAALWFTFGGLGYRDRRVRLGATLVAAAVTFWLQPVVRTIYLGQVNLILMAMIMWDLCQADTTKNGKVRWWQGFATGIAAGVKLTPLIFIPYLLLTRKFRVAAGTVAGFLFTVVVGFIFLPHDSSKWWLHGLIWTDGSRAGFIAWAGNQSLHALTSRLMGSVAAGQTAWIIASALAFALGMTAAWLFDRGGHRVVAILVTALTGLLISPISWDHHWVWIALAVAVTGHYAIQYRRRGLVSTARWLWVLVAGMILAFAAWPDAIFTSARNLGKFSLGWLWLQKNTNPILYTRYGDQSWFPEYHWHGFQLLWGNAYILSGMALLLIALFIGFRLRRSTPVAEEVTQPTVGAGVSS
jgi:alpha-1,2-mannosyltransferase